MAGSAVAGSALPAAAGDLKLTLADGRATLIAQDVPLRQILAEWARIGKTNIVNGDKLTGPPITLQLVDRPEREVLEVLLRSASGYIAAQRQVTLAGASVFESVMILPTSRGPVGVASQRAAVAVPASGHAAAMPVMEDDEPVEHAAESARRRWGTAEPPARNVPAAAGRARVRSAAGDDGPAPRHAAAAAPGSRTRTGRRRCLRASGRRAGRQE